jgi:predicted acyltransferase
MIGWALGRWMLAPQPKESRVRALMLAGAGLLVLFAVIRGVDGYGNWDLHRDSSGVLQWLHVSKYPPSLSYTCLELGIGLLVLAAFVAIDDPGRPRRALAGLELLGGTAFFYYVIHVHLMRAAQAVLGLDRNAAGLAKTWVAAAAVVALLLAPCAWWRRYKRAHPEGWARYV